MFYRFGFVHKHQQKTCIVHSMNTIHNVKWTNFIIIIIKRATCITVVRYIVLVLAVVGLAFIVVVLVVLCPSPYTHQTCFYIYICVIWQWDLEVNRLHTYTQMQIFIYAHTVGIWLTRSLCTRYFNLSRYTKNICGSFSSCIFFFFWSSSVHIHKLFDSLSCCLVGFTFTQFLPLILLSIDRK